MPPKFHLHAFYNTKVSKNTKRVVLFSSVSRDIIHPGISVQGVFSS
jgi:hypothetical protein